jgi:hypothetical protein
MSRIRGQQWLRLQIRYRGTGKNIEEMLENGSGYADFIRKVEMSSHVCFCSHRIEDPDKAQRS